MYWQLKVPRRSSNGTPTRGRWFESCQGSVLHCEDPSLVDFMWCNSPCMQVALNIMEKDILCHPSTLWSPAEGSHSSEVHSEARNGNLIIILPLHWDRVEALAAVNRIVFPQSLICSIVIFQQPQCQHPTLAVFSLHCRVLLWVNHTGPFQSSTAN